MRRMIAAGPFGCQHQSGTVSVCRPNCSTNHDPAMVVNPTEQPHFFGVKLADRCGHCVKIKYKGCNYGSLVRRLTGEEPCGFPRCRLEHHCF